MNFTDVSGLVQIPLPSNIASGFRIQAYAGPSIGGIEHEPNHFHLIDRNNNDVRICTDKFTPLDGKATRQMLKWLRKLSPEMKAYLRAQQRDIFERGSAGIEANTLGIKAATAETMARVNEERARSGADVPAIVRQVFRRGAGDDEPE